MLVKTYRIVSVNDSGRRYNTLSLFAYDPAEVVTAENVSQDYLGQYDAATRVVLKNGESVILKNSVSEIMEKANAEALKPVSSGHLSIKLESEYRRAGRVVSR